MCFSEVKREEILHKHGMSRNHDEILNVVADEWKKLSDKDRAYWDEQSRNDKVRYVREKAAWNGPSLVPKRRAKKNPLAPKRPMSAFLKFSQTRRTMVKKENPDMSNTDVSRLLGEMWRNASPKETAPYREQELLERANYNNEIKKFKAEQAHRDAESRVTHHSLRNGYGLSPESLPVDDYHHLRPLPSNVTHAFDTLRMDSFEEALSGNSGRGMTTFRPQYTPSYSYRHPYTYHGHPGELPHSEGFLFNSLNAIHLHVCFLVQGTTPIIMQWIMTILCRRHRFRELPSMMMNPQPPEVAITMTVTLPTIQDMLDAFRLPAVFPAITRNRHN